ncbi:MAG: heme o synthase [Actinomycetes bacterium]
MTAVDPQALRPTPARTGPFSRRERVLGFVSLLKPRIIELLLVTTVPTMVLAAGGFPPVGLVLATLVGGTLAAGGAHALNCYIDRDIDGLMHRTSNRAIVTGVVRPGEALVFGLALSLGSVLWFAWLVNDLSALLAGVAIAFYAVVYTLGLKRRTSQNIVWGGAAGCMPVLIGWSAVTGSLSWAPWVLFAVIFLWTPPHYWPLSMKYRRDYEAAGVPMLGAVETPSAVARQVVVYSWAMVLASLLLVPVAPTGAVYAVAAAVLGAWFLAEAHALRRRARRAERADEVRAMRLFHASITYLTLLFVAIAVDPFVPTPW